MIVSVGLSKSDSDMFWILAIKKSMKKSKYFPQK